MICPKCKQESFDEALYCRHCGAPLEHTGDIDAKPAGDSYQAEVKESKGVAIGPGARAEVHEVHLHIQGADIEELAPELISSSRKRKRGLKFTKELANRIEPEMILILSGEFIVGSDPEKDGAARNIEQPTHLLSLATFHISRAPITNTQYASFVQAGYHLPAHWEDEIPPEGREDHPVVGVSWEDAMSYCRWLSESKGEQYRLPSEVEWEKGARGTDGRIFPWGDQWDVWRCNTADSCIGDTTSVETYPSGASPYGLLDMAGNVWEWTLSLWGDEYDEPEFKYPYDPNDGRERLNILEPDRRVLRGGSFANGRDFARCATRSRAKSGFNSKRIGFRVVCTSLSQKARQE